MTLQAAKNWYFNNSPNWETIQDLLESGNLTDRAAEWLMDRQSDIQD